MRNLFSIILFGFLATSFSTAFGYPICDDHDDKDDNDYDLLKISGSTTDCPDIYFKYNNGAITISSTYFNKNLSLRICDETECQQYVVNADLSNQQESFALFLTDGTYTITTEEDKEDIHSTSTTITIQDGEGSSTIK